MANLFKALYYTLDWEGGYSDVPDDRGGKTNYGITQATLTRYVIKHPSSRVPDRVEKMSVKDAEEIYRSEYWKYDGINNQPVATKIFDMGVNFGPASAIKKVQRILGIEIDGKYGPETEKAINESDPDVLMLDLVDACMKHYEAILKADHTQEKFRKGWMRRAKSMPKDD